MVGQEMTKNQTKLFALIFVILSAISIQAIESNNKQTIEDLIFMRNFNKSNAIDAILSHNWTKNHECLMELNALKKGLIDHEGWAIKFMDSWGNFPSGVLFHRNLYEFGSFSECFHVERNGQPYETQYCIGMVKGRGGTTISLGICLPATCTVEHLEFVVNDVLHKTSGKSMSVRIPRGWCQFEESPTALKPIDFITIGLFAVVLFLMIASTGYDIFYTIQNRTKCQLFVAFSICTNGRKLFTCGSSAPASGQIQCLEGMRVLSIMWIVYNHTYRTYGKVPVHESAAYEKYSESYLSALSNAPMPVNTFLAISGLLVSNKMFKLLKKDGKLNILSLYWNRYLRLTPIFGVVVLVSISIIRFFGSGPFWLTIYEQASRSCELHWWSTLLYVQNYVNPDDVCLQVTWYLSVDMQLFIIAPALVYLIHRFKKTTLLALLISILSCICYTVPVYINNNLRTAFVGAYTRSVYNPTHVRFPSWLIGFITGYILFEYPKGSIRIPKKLNLCIWTILLAVMPVIVFANHPFIQAIPTASPLQFGVYETLSHVVWSIGVCYIIICCRYGSGGPVDRFLSLPMWQPLSRLSYCVYLIHCSMISVSLVSSKTPLHFSELSAFQYFISFFISTTLVAIPMTLAFELPIDAINKLTNGSDKRKNQQNTSL